MVKLLSVSKFSELMPVLAERLRRGIEREQQDCALPDLNKDPLWDTPAVDSKTVAKLSPVVKELTGQALDPKWIQKGGYDSIEEAVSHIISKIKEFRVDPRVVPTAVPAEEVAATAH